MSRISSLDLLDIPKEAKTLHERQEYIASILDLDNIYMVCIHRILDLVLRVCRCKLLVLLFYIYKGILAQKQMTALWS